MLLYKIYCNSKKMRIFAMLTQDTKVQKYY